MDTSSIEKEYSMYIALLLQYIEVSPEKRADVIKYNTQIGISHRIESSHRVSLMLQVMHKSVYYILLEQSKFE